MDEDDLFEDEECLQCDDCGMYYPKSALKQCKVCRNIVCASCRPKHKHRPEVSIPIEPIFDTVKEYGKSAFRTASHLFCDVLEFVFCGIVGVLRYIGVMAVIGAVLVAAVFVIGAIPSDDSVLTPGFDKIEFTPNPHIIPANEYLGQIERKTLYFDWRGTKQTVIADVDMAVYQGSLNDLSHIDPGDESWWTRKCLDSEQDVFYEDVLSDLRIIRDSQNLDSDEYAELIVSFVQSIPYDYGALVSARYPIAVFYEGRGDCDEKSMFVCGLLSKEGYDVALFDIPAEEHMTAAIKAHNTQGYVDGYIIIESTNPFLIGEIPDFKSKYPDVAYYPVGDGEMQYLKYGQVERIVRYCERFDDFMDDWYYTNVDVDRYNTYVDIYNYIMKPLNAGEREKAYSIVESYPLVL